MRFRIRNRLKDSQEIFRLKARGRRRRNLVRQARLEEREEKQKALRDDCDDGNNEECCRIHKFNDKKILSAED